MNPVCIHGFPTEQCAACRTCPHGRSANQCGRCQAEATTATRRRITVASGPTPPSEEHNGFEIYFEPAVNGWRVRAPDDGSATDQSYRSVFLARKAIDGMGSTATSATATSTRKRR
jgi:hypothetical protein